MAMRWALGLMLVLAACSHAPARRATVDASATTGPADTAEIESLRASGAVTYVPPPTRVPEGAIDRVLLERVLAAGPGWLLSEVELRPTFLAKHKFNGFKVVSLFRNDPKVLRYGVLPGDIVRAINGQKLVTPGDLLLVFARLKLADTLEIDVQRDGVDRRLRFPIVPALGLAWTASPADPTAATGP